MKMLGGSGCGTKEEEKAKAPGRLANDECGSAALTGGVLINGQRGTGSGRDDGTALGLNL